MVLFVSNMIGVVRGNGRERATGLRIETEGDPLLEDKGILVFGK
jgi:hypothetical protein